MRRRDTKEVEAALRVTRNTSGATTIYVFSGATVIAEYAAGAGTGSPSREYIYAGSRLLATIESGATKYHHADHLSIRATTDSSGTVVATRGHLPFGESWYTTGSAGKNRFTSYERDLGANESGSDYAIFRFHMNRLGRFNRPDPVAGSILDPQSLNRYAYVRNNPINRVDPLGLTDEGPCGGAMSCIIVEGGTGSINVLMGGSDLFELVRSTDSPGQGGGGGILIPPPQRNRGGQELSTLPPNDCAVFASSPTNRLWNEYMALNPDDPSLIRAVGQRMMEEGWNNRPASGGTWKTLPVNGFKSELVANPQRGDAYRHFLYVAGSILADEDLRRLGMRSWDWAQSIFRTESVIEVRDNAAGAAVGRAMLTTASASRSGNYASLFQTIAGILCAF